MCYIDVRGGGLILIEQKITLISPWNSTFCINKQPLKNSHYSTDKYSCF